ncbi:unnamed protein product [Rotaria socialis]|uniref:Exostosin GT47 domain-containing protein n=1 Tax=Rotaria socialis TaxID=392032 RepID=A0A821UE01_9BILA|nr:unnamed protein product [Rotaria socialis]
MQNRLILDTTFANWFYFDYCYNSPLSLTKNLNLCPFENKLWHFYPTPPTFFVALDSDPSIPMKRYTELIKLMRNNSLQLGGQLLNQEESIMLSILSPVNLTPSYMQQNFDLWYNKPYASRIFFEHYNNLAARVTNDTKHGTCRCSKTNFTYWEGFTNITTTWSLQKQAEHKDYVQDIKNFRSMFCEDLCGDIMVYHGIVSRNIGKALDWITKIDLLRHSLLIQDYISRPLRVWMYRKQSLNNGIENFSSQKVDWTVVVRKSTTTTTIEGISYETLLIADDNATSDEYIKSMLRSVFSICPETFRPWSYRIYEAIQLGVIPVILADNVVLPFERFISWQSFSVKINVSNLHEIINRVSNITSFKRYIAQKLRYASSYSHIFRWPYAIDNRVRYKKETLVTNEYFNGNAPNVFRYISLEMRCRRLEQLYGFTSDTSSPISIAAQQKACNNHPTICPCHSKWPPLAFQEYI